MSGVHPLLVRRMCVRALRCAARCGHGHRRLAEAAAPAWLPATGARSLRCTMLRGRLSRHHRIRLRAGRSSAPRRHSCRSHVQRWRERSRRCGRRLRRARAKRSFSACLSRARRPFCSLTLSRRRIGKSSRTPWLRRSAGGSQKGRRLRRRVWTTWRPAEARGGTARCVRFHSEWRPQLSVTLLGC